MHRLPVRPNNDFHFVQIEDDLMKFLMLCVILLTLNFHCAPSNPDTLLDPSEVEEMAREFQNLAHSFNYDGLDAAATVDFEFTMMGRRMSMDDFHSMLKEMDDRRDGRPLGSYEIYDFKTKILGDVAFTSWASDGWLESAVFVREGDQWLMDRALAQPVEAVEEE